MPDTLKQPRLIAPAGTCDTHIHVYDSQYPTAPTATMTPPNASIDEYKTLCRRLRIERCVIVQPTTYGKDNRCTLQAIKAFGPGARGIAVVDETVESGELERLTKAGIRGVRMHMLPGGALTWDSFGPVSRLVQEHGWHVQLQLDGRLLPEKEATIKGYGGTLVIDHTGKFLEPVSVDDPAFRILLRLLENGRTYVKLSAPYEVSKVGPPGYADVGALAKALVRAAPDRMLWASNWPHPSATAAQRPDDADMLDLLLNWAPDDATRQKILVDNPARLYGF